MRGISPAFGFTTLLLAGVMMLSVVLVPRTDFGPDVMKKGWTVMSIPWKAMETELGRVLSFLPAQIPYTIHKFGDAFPFRGASNLGDHVVMRISSDQPAYWRARDIRHLHAKRVADWRESRPERGVPTGRGRRDSGLQRYGAYRAVGGDGGELGCDLCGCEPAAR